jgi:glucose/arabinose dehydrogenase
VPTGNSFGGEFREGAFLAFHGSWNRAPLPQAGFRVVFMPFTGGKATGAYSTFATMGGDYTQFRASGVAFAPDGSALYIGSDARGKIWRVIKTPGR